MGTELIDDEEITKVLTFQKYRQQYDGWGRYTLKRGYYGYNADGESLVAFMAFTDGDANSIHAYFTKAQLKEIAMQIMGGIL